VKFAKSRVWDRVPDGSRPTLILELAEFLENTVKEGSKEAAAPKTSSVRSAVSMELRLPTDRETDTDTDRQTSESVQGTKLCRKL